MDRADPVCFLFTSFFVKEVGDRMEDLIMIYYGTEAERSLGGGDNTGVLCCAGLELERAGGRDENRGEERVRSVFAKNLSHSHSLERGS